MISKIIKRISGNQYRKFIKRKEPVVAEINRIEEGYQGLSEAELRGKTDEFKRRLKGGETLDDLLPEAFAACKSASRRLSGRTVEFCGFEVLWEMVYFDVQLIGGIALHEKKIAEMATGEGKTLVATLALYLNALTGKNCQLVTVNDYLARRDAEWMGHLYKLLGLTVGCIQNSMGPEERREMYGRDITYGTASEFGFDYLRDNGMATRKEDQVQRDHYFCIIDEVDSILVDEARTPLIISGPVQIDRELPFQEKRPIIERLVREQTNHCNRMVAEAQKLLQEGDELPNPAEDDTAWSMLLQVKQGSPKNKQFLRLMQDGSVHKLYEKYDLEMGSDYNKARFFQIKEELFYVIDEKGHHADLTERGREFLAPGNPDAFLLPDLPTRYMEIDNDRSLDPEAKDRAKAELQEHFERTSEEIHTISQLLRAYALYERDVQYVVEGGKVVIVDENTGRKMPGRRWSEGLHQAVEAKEGVEIEKETKTYATVTIQNYFRMYEKLAGMTGTAETEVQEFRDIYGLDVMVVPTNQPIARADEDDIIYRTRRDKYNAVVEEVREAQKHGQPVLVGTVSVDASEVLSRMLKRASITHNVLNAKYHEREAEIVARAGQRGSVTIATNMAGRGTDIKLGEGVSDLGGLYVIGTERHTSRRIDRQLRGRSGRQGDPGLSRFFISLEDDLLRLFANSGAIGKMLEKSVGEGDVPLPTWVIENAQKRVEEQRYAGRKQLLKYDDVLNQQREVVYALRNDALHSETPIEIIWELVEEELEVRLEEMGPGAGEEAMTEAVEGFLHWANTHFPIALRTEDVAGEAGEVHARVLEKIKAAYAMKASVEIAESLAGLERYVIVTSIDKHWQDHLTEMDSLRQEISMVGIGQKDPLQEYKKYAYTYFEQMMVSIRGEVCLSLFRSATNLEAFENMLAQLSRRARTQGPENQGASESTSGRPGKSAGSKPADEIQLPKITIKKTLPKIGRNEVVTIRRGSETKTMKFKKAEKLIEEGWQLELPGK